MAFGSEVMMMAGLGYLVLGPKRMHEMLTKLARLKSEFAQATRNMKTQLAADIDESSGSQKAKNEDAADHHTTAPQRSAQ